MNQEELKEKENSEEVETQEELEQVEDQSTEVATDEMVEPAEENQPAPEEPVEETESAEEETQEEKWLSQSRVNELVGRARQEGRESAMRELFNRYGVSQETEMDDVFGKGQAYDSLNDEYTGVSNSYKEIMAENALLKSQIDVNRWEDVKLILNGKGLDVTAENINLELATHPEWKSSLSSSLVKEEDNITPIKPTVIRKLGGDISPKPDEISEEEKFKRLFGFN